MGLFYAKMASVDLIIDMAGWSTLKSFPILIVQTSQFLTSDNLVFGDRVFSLSVLYAQM
jgi:hypothetical protein